MGSDWWTPAEDQRPSPSRRVARWSDHGASLFWEYEVRAGNAAGSVRIGELVIHGTQDGDLLMAIREEVR